MRNDHDSFSDLLKVQFDVTILTKTKKLVAKRRYLIMLAKNPSMLK